MRVPQVRGTSLRTQTPERHESGKSASPPEQRRNQRPAPVPLRRAHPSGAQSGRLGKSPAGSAAGTGAGLRYRDPSFLPQGPGQHPFPGAAGHGPGRVSGAAFLVAFRARTGGPAGRLKNVRT